MVVVRRVRADDAQEGEAFGPRDRRSARNAFRLVQRGSEHVLPFVLHSRNVSRQSGQDELGDVSVRQRRANVRLHLQSQLVRAVLRVEGSRLRLFGDEQDARADPTSTPDFDAVIVPSTTANGASSFDFSDSTLVPSDEVASEFVVRGGRVSEARVDRVSEGADCVGGKAGRGLGAEHLVGLEIRHDSRSREGTGRHSYQRERHKLVRGS